MDKELTLKYTTSYILGLQELSELGQTNYECEESWIQHNGPLNHSAKKWSKMINQYIVLYHSAKRHILHKIWTKVYDQGACT